jgi:hypothetical protein
VVFFISRQKGAGRNNKTGGCPKSTQTEVNIAALLIIYAS